MPHNASTIQAALAHDLHAAPSSLDPDIPFPENIFPHHIDAWLTGCAAALRVPVAWLAFPFLAFTGAVAGPRVRLRLTPAWLESPNLWVVLVGPAGSGKSTALKAAREPFEHLHYQGWVAHRKAAASWLATGHMPATFDPLLTTTSALAQLRDTLRASTGLAIHRDELYGLIRTLDRRRGEDRQHYRSLWSGEPLIGQGANPATDLYDHVLAIVGGIQPLLLRAIARDHQDGLLERFLLVFPSGTLTPWHVIHPAGHASATGIAAHLAPLRARSARDPVATRFDPAAETTWAAWFDANLETHKQVSPALGGYYRKLPTQLARIALVLHLLWHLDAPESPLALDTLNRAIRLVDYLKVHIHRAAWVIGEPGPAADPETRLKERVIRVLTEHADNWLLRSRLAVALGRPPTAKLDAALSALTREQRIETRTRRPGTPGRPSTEYRLKEGSAS